MKIKAIDPGLPSVEVYLNGHRLACRTEGDAEAGIAKVTIFDSVTGQDIPHPAVPAWYQSGEEQRREYRQQQAKYDEAE